MSSCHILLYGIAGLLPPCAAEALVGLHSSDEGLGGMLSADELLCASRLAAFGHAADGTQQCNLILTHCHMPVCSFLQAYFRRAQLKALVGLHSSDEGLGGTLSADEISIITGALDLTSKTAWAAMTPLDKVRMRCDVMLLHVQIV
jgi:hypothetical protein